MREMDYKRKIIKREELPGIINRENKKVVFTNGCFDIIHPGHLQYLYKAAQLGEILIIGVNSDSSVKMLKGESRPIFPHDERAGHLAALEFVDYVIIFPEKDPVRTIEIVRPDIHVKGGDYKSEEIIEMDAVERSGGKVVILEHYGGYSTTNILKDFINKCHIY